MALLSLYTITGSQCDVITEGAVNCTFSNDFCGFTNGGGDGRQLRWEREFWTSDEDSNRVSIAL